MNPTTLTVSAVLAALPSADPSRTEAFVERLLGRPVDERPMPVLSQWRLGDEVLQVVHDPGRAGGGLVSLVVPDMATAVAGLRERGLDVEAEAGTVVAKLLVLHDPDGNQITLVEAADRG